MTDDLSTQIAALRQQLAALEAQQVQQERIRLAQSGAGAMATSHSTAAGKRGVAVHGDAVGNVILTGNVYMGAPTRDPAQALAIYRRVLMASARHMSLRGLHVSASDPTSAQQPFDLTQVYVDLHTTTQVARHDAERPPRRRAARVTEPETRPLSALEAVVQQRHLVLLGAPGSGKSTFLTYLGLCLAAHGVEAQDGWLARLTGWPDTEADLVPITVVLRDFARGLPVRAKRAEPEHLWQFIQRRLKAQNLAFAASALRQRLDDPQGKVLLLLDGLDEIPTAPQRAFVRDAVAAFISRYAHCRVVLTCRTLSYQDPALQLPKWAAVTLAPFDEEQIDRFIAAWYHELARLGSVSAETVAGLTQHLQRAIRRPDLWRLANNPLLLTVMALVHTHKGRLPEARALLYEETVDILLWRWEQLKASAGDEVPRLQALLTDVGRADTDLKQGLWRLAYEAHGQGGTAGSAEVADIDEATLANALRALHPQGSRDWAYQVIEVMQLRAGLLLERVPGVYALPHRTFQEYLAGAHLSTLADFPTQAARLAAEGALWREVILLAVGRLVYLSGETARPLALVAELCPTLADNTPVAWQQAWLAGDVLLEMGLNRVHDTKLGRELAARVGQRLVALLRGGHLSPVQRAAAGNTLATLGDPRFRADAWCLPDEPLLGFMEIPAGPFLMGSDPARDAEADTEEQPQHEVVLPRYYLARYPVTVAQWMAFVQASGHTPRDAESLQAIANHPVAFVSWHEVLAYCQWLTVRLREWPGTPEPLAHLLRQEGWGVTLPSEAEWEKAARGTDGRRYPWGDELDTNRMNCWETGFHSTSAVGCFSGGASPYEVEDMSGNRWEWTRSLWGRSWTTNVFPYPYTPGKRRERLQAASNMRRVLRGGAYWRMGREARCANRFGGGGVLHLSQVGFRVVVRSCSGL